MRIYFLGVFLALGLAAQAQEAAKLGDGPFLIKPYVQLGEKPSPTCLQICWVTADTDAKWSIEYRTQPGEASWMPAEKLELRRIDLEGVTPRRVYRATLEKLVPGDLFRYRISKAEENVFRADARAPKNADQPYRFVVFGDCGANTPEEREIAYRTMVAKPDYVMITGDIVYDRGRISEYDEKYWPIYNSEEASPKIGAPLMRSILFTAAPGNHDILSRDFTRDKDALAYFLYWSQPLNGPPATEKYPYVKPLTASPEAEKAFLKSAGEAYPRMANFSFDYGNAHWTVLDADAYVGWNNKDLQQWVADDLAKAKNATWRFVSFHQPGFNSSKAHFEEQMMRLLAPVFEAGKVDVVFNGHVHNYQRSFPLKFVPDALENPVQGKIRFVPGKWTLDKKFDGRTNTQPDGVIYLVTGAGGNHLYNPEQEGHPETFQEFTDKFISKGHSLTVVDVVGSTLVVRQLDTEGKEIDKFNIIK